MRNIGKSEEVTLGLKVFSERFLSCETLYKHLG